ncbi:glycosyltransferase [Winogradskyella sediminis]|uniref:glycosyltransferase n=1 Tax=Winogradskyella sediminis TaxID=1382466 RepID=UPI000E251F39|nr:glycosyltransferase [Winogradskyella sediminis]REG87228.1 putative rhamnosyltransferase [Winogradskyella sediminis]
MFKHYLITRFNLKNKNWDVTKNNESLLTREWMTHRIKLFSNFCLPSVANQTNTNFEWLLFFDSTTDTDFKAELEALIVPYPHFIIFYIDGMDAFHPAIKSYISKDSVDIPYVITSRIDNDDCIHKDYISVIQSQFQSQDFMAIDILKGYSLQVSPDIMLGKKEHIFNPFISLIEKNDTPKTVWFSDHNMWKKESRRVEIANQRLWMSIIHEKNKVNEFDGYDNVNWDTIKTDFIVSDEINTKVSKHIIPHKDWRYLSLKNKLYVNYVLMSKKLKKAIGLYKIK